MNLYESILNKKEKISLVGLGYVGLPIAISFAKKVDVIGFDICKVKVQQYKDGFDPTKEVGNDAVKNTTMKFTCDEAELKKCKFHIVAVPTPVRADKTPDLTPIINASRTLGRNLVRGAYVVYESTVYPGVTEDICVPILESESGLKCGIDFKVGYSPERINPGDKVHRLETIIKVVSGMDDESLELIAKVYELVVDAGVHRANSIKVAEAAKVIENSQRDVNIAFVNELSIIFNEMGIDTLDVLEAAGTKWNFLNFKPGLVGGHCIGVDPYYLTYKAAELGYHSQVILSGRRINDGMGKFVIENLVKKIISADIPVKKAKVAIFGFTFKEDCPDTRNTRVIDMVDELNEYGITPYIIDPVADKEEAKHEYGLEFDNLKDVSNLDAIIVAVRHEEFKSLSKQELDKLYAKNTKKIIFDIKGSLNRLEFEEDYIYWRL
ncbi:nucleotide sugar dehydrogenase [Francisella sp. LA112445]|uniref:nucleotide sugar dehydrogenase n=1 Tax=Francisella sp. LA112445 TaxID=1395624 RepID=UPI001788CBBC|nr:nucleotide sugar dehydrogenase [Francisella sp. LA112445]QIW09651.1 nucleotide sugar dehydrogenase [Francisella sp. LA112445]